MPCLKPPCEMVHTRSPLASSNAKRPSPSRGSSVTFFCAGLGGPSRPAGRWPEGNIGQGVIHVIPIRCRPRTEFRIRRHRGSRQWIRKRRSDGVHAVSMSECAGLNEYRDRIMSEVQKRRLRRLQEVQHVTVQVANGEFASPVGR
jgi:hypothetical protein